MTWSVRVGLRRSPARALTSARKGAASSAAVADISGSGPPAARRMRMPAEAATTAGSISGLQGDGLSGPSRRKTDSGLTLTLRQGCTLSS